MHSPVWQTYDPTYDTTEYLSDWEYESDEYYDQEFPKERRVKVDETDKRRPDMKRKLTGPDPRKRKRRKLDSMDDIPDLSLGEDFDTETSSSLVSTPLVVWKKREASPALPVVVDGQGEKVALLKDWREKFKDTTVNPRKASSTKSSSRTLPKQKGVAVVIERRPSESEVPKKINSSTKLSSTRIPPTTKVSIKSKTKVSFAPLAKEVDKQSMTTTKSTTTKTILTQRANEVTPTRRRSSDEVKDEKEKEKEKPGRRKATVDMSIRQSKPDVSTNKDLGTRKRKAQDTTPEVDSACRGQTRAQQNSTKSIDAAQQTATVRKSKRLKRG